MRARRGERADREREIPTRSELLLPLYAALELDLNMGLNTIDLGAFLQGKISPSEEQELAKSFVDLSSRWGFFYVRGYESVVPKELVDKVFEYVRAFACLPALPEAETERTERELLRPAAKHKGPPGVRVKQGQPWLLGSRSGAAISLQG